jgi:hypothetical protein
MFNDRKNRNQPTTLIRSKSRDFSWIIFAALATLACIVVVWGLTIVL